MTQKWQAATALGQQNEAASLSLVKRAREGSMNSLKVIGGLLALAGIVVPLIQLQAMVNAAHADMASPDAGSVLHQAMPGILSWTVPLNVASAVLIAVGVFLMVWERKGKRRRTTS